MGHTLASWAASAFLLNLLVVELFVSESEFFLGALDLVHKLALIKRLFGNNLPSQVLDLGCQSLFNGIVFFTHNFAPD